jgi:glycosyltransferase involved in cell wall biosynthesis
MTLSNAALILECDDNRVKARESLHTIGLLSNLSEEKGVMEFLDLCQILQTEGLAVRAKLAGPFQDKQIESRVRARLAHLANTEYVGPRRGAEKDEFYRGIDAFVFPTRYRNETEPLVILESLHNGVPVIAFGRGTIPELIDDSCGHVIAVGSDFVTEAERCIRRWLEHPASFSASSRASRRRFESIYSAARDARERLLSLLTGTPYRGAVLDDRARDEAAQ